MSAQTQTSHSGGQFHRRYRQDEKPIDFSLNGVAQVGRLGDTVLTAIMAVSSHVRQTEFTGENRAGFCLIGACQDCYVMTEEGQRLRACTTPLQEGMRFVTAMPVDAGV
ncbi:(2Fe-2S)-binding protein [Pseudochrobactrum sp. AO18b]|uniref:(2Fe-2S)-binding protein n=1 Tax=Pseudochrobactrum sp. AO18b TaxID=1201036 RepID=UPI0003A3A429|nr:(2Fe-2S)-binding protein [Pseudochrobactrum sp. AO18b]